MNNSKTGTHLSATLVTALALLCIGLSLIVLAVYLPNTELGWLDRLRDAGRQAGTVFLTTGLIGIFTQFVIRRGFVQEMKSRLTETLNERFDFLEELRLAGINGSYSMLPTDTLAKTIPNAKRVRILQTWTGNIHAIRESLRLAADNGCDVRILLLEPESPLAHIRGKDMGISESQYASSQIRGDLEILQHLHEGKDGKKFIDSGKIKVRLYKTFPGVSLYQIDNVTYMGLYLRNKSSISSPGLTIDSRVANVDSPFFAEALEDHFDAIWEDARDLYSLTETSGEEGGNGRGAPSSTVSTTP